MADGKWTRPAWRFPDRAGSIVVLRLMAVALVVSLNGCSLIGLGIGAGVQVTRSRDLRHLTPERAAYLRTGSLLTLVMTDSSTITGVLLEPQFTGGVDSRQTGLQLAHLRSERPAILDTLLVPLDQVAYARSPRPRHAARSGFHAGLMVDLALLGIAGAITIIVLLILLMLSASGFSFG